MPDTGRRSYDEVSALDEHLNRRLDDLRTLFSTQIQNVIDKVDGVAADLTEVREENARDHKDVVASMRSRDVTSTARIEALEARVAMVERERTQEQTVEQATNDVLARHRRKLYGVTAGLITVTSVLGPYLGHHL